MHTGIDVLFMLFMVVSLLAMLMSVVCKLPVGKVRSLSEGEIFELFGFSHMEIKGLFTSFCAFVNLPSIFGIVSGYRRLRTISQLLFETIPVCMCTFVPAVLWVHICHPSANVPAVLDAVEALLR